MKEEKILEKIEKSREAGNLDWSIYDPDKETITSIESLIKKGHKFEKIKMGKAKCYIINL